MILVDIEVVFIIDVCVSVEIVYYSNGVVNNKW